MSVASTTPHSLTRGQATWKHPSGKISAVIPWWGNSPVSIIVEQDSGLVNSCQNEALDSVAQQNKSTCTFGAAGLTRKAGGGFQFCILWPDHGNMKIHWSQNHAGCERQNTSFPLFMCVNLWLGWAEYCQKQPYMIVIQSYKHQASNHRCFQSARGANHVGGLSFLHFGLCSALQNRTAAVLFAATQRVLRHRNAEYTHPLCFCVFPSFFT